MAKDLFNRYVWLVDTIHQAGRITYKEINQRWERRTGETIPLRTFNNHRTAIEELFEVAILCDRKDDNRYYIENPEDLEGGGVRSWLLNTFAINNLINESRQLKNRILFEQIPSGQKYLTPLIEAMRDGVSVEITYQSYWHDQPTTFTIEPYCVKVFRQRWYVVGRSSHHGTLRIYGLDRIQYLSVTEQRFQIDPDFDGESYFYSSFGAIVGDEQTKPEIVRIKVYDNQVCYIRSLPLHHSQREVETTEEYSVFEFFIRLTYDFRQELLSHGESVEVLTPHSLRLELKETARQLNQYYRK